MEEIKPCCGNCIWWLQFSPYRLLPLWEGACLYGEPKRAWYRKVKYPIKKYDEVCKEYRLKE